MNFEMKALKQRPRKGLRRSQKPANITGSLEDAPLQVLCRFFAGNEGVTHGCNANKLLIPEKPLMANRHGKRLSEGGHENRILEQLGHLSD